MTNKATVVAPANIAFVKYWGAKDLAVAIPHTPSISMTLHQCHSLCSVAFSPDDQAEDEVYLREASGVLRVPGPAFSVRVFRHLERLRAEAGVQGSFRVVTENSFPSAAGLASSASGFAALTLAATRALGLDLNATQLSILARLSGSGSAARSVMGGYVEWPAEEEGGYPAAVLAPWDHWALCDVIALVETEPKKVSSLEGHRRATTSPHFEARLQLLGARLQAVREAIQARDIDHLGSVLEEEAIELHMIAMSSRPPIFYWKPATLAVLEAVRHLREEGVPSYATMDAGANVHVICPATAEADVADRLGAVAGVQAVLRDRVGPGPVYRSDHLV